MNCWDAAPGDRRQDCGRDLMINVEQVDNIGLKLIQHPRYAPSGLWKPHNSQCGAKTAQFSQVSKVNVRKKEMIVGSRLISRMLHGEYGNGMAFSLHESLEIEQISLCAGTQVVKLVD
jgi:hypothetical protein